MLPFRTILLYPQKQKKIRTASLSTLEVVCLREDVRCQFAVLMLHFRLTYPMNTLYYGDNLKILRDYIKDESIDLVYLDPR